MTAYEYIGGGDWFPGVPARNLTEAEASEYAEILESEAGKRLYRAIVKVQRVADRAAKTTEDKQN